MLSEQVYDVDAVKCFFVDELEGLVCGEGPQHWTRKELRANIIPSHGYSETR